MSEELKASTAEWTKREHGIVSTLYRGYLVSTYFSGIHWNAWIKDSVDVIVNMKIRSGEESARRLALSVVDSLGDSMAPYVEAVNDKQTTETAEEQKAAVVGHTSDGAPVRVLHFSQEMLDAIDDGGLLVGGAPESVRRR